jgi:hypothetical protein
VSPILVQPQIRFPKILVYRKKTPKKKKKQRERERKEEKEKLS